MRDIHRDEWRSFFEHIANGKTLKEANRIVFIDPCVSSDYISHQINRDERLLWKYNRAKELRKLIYAKRKLARGVIYSRKYRKTAKGRATYQRRLASTRKTGPLFKFKRNRNNPEYRKWEALMRKARRAAHALDVPMKEIVAAWGIESWREHRWKLVNYGKHDIV